MSNLYHRKLLELMRKYSGMSFDDLLKEEEITESDIDYVKNSNGKLIDVIILLMIGGQSFSLSYQDGLDYDHGNIKITMDYKDKKSLFNYFCDFI